MATGSGLDQGKTTFVSEYLKAHRDSTEKAVAAAWTAAGHPGTVSGSLVSKIRRKLGLTRGGRSTEAASKPKRRVARATVRETSDHTTPRPSAVGQQEHPAQHLDELEDAIGDLIQRVRTIGEMPEVIRALRRARRLLFQDHES